VRHILIRPSEILSSDDARQQLLDLRAKILKGASFPEMARLHSDDPGSARNGGDLSWVSKGEMVPEFDQVMLATPAGQISDVFQSSYGWHILEVEAIRNQDMSQQYRDSQARQALYERQYDEELNAWLREMRGSAYIDIKDGAATTATP
jgi:peptidyl-prolyl cis-trans isomerase SurA